MKKHEITAEIFHFSIPDIKDDVVKAIDSMGTFSYVVNDQKISNTDWHLSEQYDRPYGQVLVPRILEEINKGNGIAYKSLYIQNFWHQQYEQGDYHGWHTHGDAIYSSVYYAELPEGSATTFRINGEERQFDVQEGDYIVFPSFIEHCSKPNNTGTRKTIVSLNLNPEG